MSESERTSPSVKSMRHKKILDVAENHPEASMEEIATEIPSATVDLVERILDKHGDPATEESDSADTDSDETDNPPDETNVNNIPSLDELSAKERETLRAIYENPEATQEEIGEILGLVRATVSRRLDEIDGCQWADREEFVSRLFDGVSASEETETDAESTEIDVMERITKLEEKLTDIEQQITDSTRPATAEAVFTDPDLTHKMLHACLKADTISEEEELQILQEMMQ